VNEPTIKNFWNHFWEQLSNTKLIRYLLLFALGWALVQVLAYFETVIVIFIFAAILAFLLNYPVQWVSRFLPRPTAVIIVFLLSLLIIGGLIATLGFTAISQAEELLNQAPQLLDSLISGLERIQEILTNWNFQVDFETLEGQLREQAMAGIGIGLGTVQGLLTNLVDLIIIAVVAFFMLLDGKRIWNFLLKAFPEAIRHDLIEAIQRNFLGFFWGRLILSVFFGVSVYVVFVVLGLSNALILAAIAGIFDLIPGIGATIGITLVSLIVLPQGIWQSVKVLIGCILLQQLEENFLMPRIMQGSINMNPVFMFFALLVGARIAGLVGVFLSIPIAGVLISLFDLKEMQGES
jgi:predicted PurR-regulated permease PerM